ncbi:immunoglobulin-like protein involved in spore germination [Salegentibacter sp. 24]|uniref:Gmad2 immunoglobulin-like domain-containing protein n=1 Tax=Salegentibacter sp. 24 TaxID=2183986 RepID=UPI00105C26BE|nr:Gmad2 immunoglobulin-like domain-containing protein [Salegentibacter sp. 24]TDN87229.1 immunoglobulin-like protein involved in spore germination [Salegentibacter sp. 24]
MKMLFLWILLFLASSGCKNPKNNTGNSQAQPAGHTKDSLQSGILKYKDTIWNFAFKYPSDYTVIKGKLPGNSIVINVYPKAADIDKPLAIHEKPERSYIAFLPKGFGVDAPSGEQKSVMDSKINFNLTFNINEQESMVYLLENGQAWAYFIRFDQPPEKWNRYGGIFVHNAIRNFNASCFSSSGKLKPMQQCDPMGEDRIKISGEIDKTSKRKLDLVLNSLYFFSEDAKQRRELSELIKVKNPIPNTQLKSPLQITGKARGSWFFEGEAPVKLVDKNYRTLARTSIKASGDWMTSNFVPFSGALSFENFPEGKPGYLIFEKSNASGKPEFDRELILPVRFPPQ